MFRKVIIPFFVIALLGFYNCSRSEDCNTCEEEIIVEEPDSTLYYDSVYAPLAFELDTFFQKRYDKTTFYGNVLFAERGRTIFEKSYGFADWKKKDTLSLEHTFQLASASKPFTAVATLILAQRGELKLDDPVEKYIPSFPYQGIDIHQLLSHRSGLSQYTHFCDAPDSIWPDKHKTIHNQDVIDLMADIVPMVNYPPDTKHYYCNTNFLLLAQIIEKVSGVTYEEFLQKNIFDPCNMTSTVVYNRDNKEELILPVKGYTGNYTPCIDIYLNGCTGDKGIYSNVHDLLNFDQALYDETLLTNKYKELAFKEHNDQKNNGQNYGYGFRITYDDEKGKIPFHTGWWKGFRTYFVRIPDKQQTIIIISNIKRGPFFKVNDLVNLLP